MRVGQTRTAAFIAFSANLRKILAHIGVESETVRIASSKRATAVTFLRNNPFFQGGSRCHTQAHAVEMPTRYPLTAESFGTPASSLESAP
jgi:hypothetical protein